MTLTHPAPAPTLTDDDIDRRVYAIADLIETATLGSGQTITFLGDGVEIAETVECANGRGLVPMAWQDGAVGGWLDTQLHDPTLDETLLPLIAGFAVAAAATRNAAHELCEFLTYQGKRLIDPHPTGSRFDNQPLLDVTLRYRATDGSRSWAEPTPKDLPVFAGCYPYVDVPEDEAAEIAEAVLASLACSGGPGGPNQTWEVWGGRSIGHTATFPDRDTGDLREWNWSPECLGDLMIPAAAIDRRSAIASTILCEAVRVAVESYVHEIAETVHIGGVRIFDPHPINPLTGNTYAQIDQIMPNLHWRISPLAHLPKATR